VVGVFSMSLPQFDRPGSWFENVGSIVPARFDLATQASLAIHLTRLAKSARQSAVLEERNQLAAEIHDALAQSFTAISM
jgi:signal transduction histidine kinase